MSLREDMFDLIASHLPEARADFVATWCGSLQGAGLVGHIEVLSSNTVNSSPVFRPSCVPNLVAVDIPTDFLSTLTDKFERILIFFILVQFAPLLLHNFGVFIMFQHRSCTSEFLFPISNSCRSCQIFFTTSNSHRIWQNVITSPSSHSIWQIRLQLRLLGCQILTDFLLRLCNPYGQLLAVLSQTSLEWKQNSPMLVTRLQWLLNNQ